MMGAPNQRRGASTFWRAEHTNVWANPETTSAGIPSRHLGSRCRMGPKAVCGFASDR